MNEKIPFCIGQKALLVHDEVCEVDEKPRLSYGEMSKEFDKLRNLAKTLDLVFITARAPVMSTLSMKKNILRGYDDGPSFVWNTISCDYGKDHATSEQDVQNKIVENRWNDPAYRARYCGLTIDGK